MSKRTKSKTEKDPPPAPVIPIPRTSRSAFGRNLANWLFPIYVLVIMLAYFALRTEGAMAHGNELTKDRALSTAVNVATLTGFQQTIGLDQFLTPARLTVFFLMIISTMMTLTIASL